MRGATRKASVITRGLRFQSTRPMRGATTFFRSIGAVLFVSIHAPHAGRDAAGLDVDVRRGVSIHAPHAGRDHHRPDRPAPYGVSIHAPHAGRDLLVDLIDESIRVSIHAPHAGRDSMRRWIPSSVRRFNPRAPCGARHSRAAFWLYLSTVSIHAPHAGRDLRHKDTRTKLGVSIHAPHAGRDVDKFRTCY